MSSSDTINPNLFKNTLFDGYLQDDILQPIAVPLYLQTLGPNAIFQDDNPRPHRARLVTDYLNNFGVQRMDWPANSQNLNPMEHLWDQLGLAVRARTTNTSTVADLTRFLNEEWNAIPHHQRITRLLCSMRRRCQAVINAFGSSTRY